MSILTAAADAELLVITWLKDGPVADLLVRPDGGHNIFQSMPLGAPATVVVVKRAGGAIPRRSDIPYERARISFDCRDTTRTGTWAIAGLLIGQLNNLGELGGFHDPAIGTLFDCEHLSTRWLPDRESDAPRYIVDGLFTVLAA